MPSSTTAVMGSMGNGSASASRNPSPVLPFSVRFTVEGINDALTLGWLKNFPLRTGSVWRDLPPIVSRIPPTVCQ